MEARLGRGRGDDVDLFLFVPGQATDAPGATGAPQWHPTGAIAPVGKGWEYVRVDLDDLVSYLYVCIYVCIHTLDA